MDGTIRSILSTKLGSIMLANAELAAENMRLAAKEKEHLQHIEMLQAELSRWQDDARKRAEKEQSECALEQLQVH